jgi:hypothetical protein
MQIIQILLAKVALLDAHLAQILEINIALPVEQIQETFIISI